MKKKVLLTSVVTIILCLCLIAGSTFALFTSTASVNVAVTSGTVAVNAYVDETSLKLTSFNRECKVKNTFENGGTANILENGTKLELNRMTPGDAVKFKIKVNNTSDVDVQYRVRAYVNGELIDVLKFEVVIDGVGHGLSANTANEPSLITKWMDIGEIGADKDVFVYVTFPNSNDHATQNLFQGKKADVTIVIDAVQANGVDEKTGKLIGE